MSRNHLPARHRWLVLAVTLTCVGGCNVTGKRTTEVLQKLKLVDRRPPRELPKAGPTTVVTDATALALELPESDLQARQQFRQRFEKLISEERFAAAERLVARRPDLAHQVLCNQTAQSRPELLALASCYDRACGNEAGWHAMMTDANAEPIDAYFKTRTQLFGAIGNGDFEATGQTDLVTAAEQTGHPPLLADAWFQTGVAYLLRQQNLPAADAFASAIDHAGMQNGSLAAQAGLMRSEALRRGGQFAAAGDAWQQAVNLACQQIRRQHFTDPAFWDRAVYIRPVGSEWPACVVETFAAIGNAPASVVRTDLLRQLASVHQHGELISAACWIEAGLGSWRQARGETQKALVHLKKAETVAGETAKDWLRISQSPLLLALGQRGTATTLLAPIIAREDDSPQMLAAMSQLGAMKLTGRSQQHGIRLLHRAVVESAAVEWPGKASSQADLALGLLMIGEKAEGMAQLRAAQARFKSEGDLELLAKSLWNEKQYLDHSDADRETIAAVDDRLQTMQF